MTNAPIDKPFTPRIKPARLWNTLRVAYFLANRQIRASTGTGLLIVLVMVLTYLNLLVVSGIMVGLIQGLREENQANYAGEILITNPDKKDLIQNSPDVLAYLHALPTITAFSARYVVPGTLQANYAGKLEPQDKVDSFSTAVAGFDPITEDALTNLSSLVVEGQYLQPTDYNQILVGTSILARYEALTTLAGETPIPNVGVGSKVRLIMGGIEHEMTIKGIVASKLQGVNLRIFMIDSQMRLMLGRTDGAVNEIAVKLVPGTDAAAFTEQLRQSSIGADAKIQTEIEAEPAFMKNFATMFNQLGSFLGSIGLVVAFVVVFILVLINTVMRRRSIGILQAIGIHSAGIEISYVVQSVLYAIVGAVIGMIIIFTTLVPFFVTHPINFPFSNGILAVTFSEALIKALILVFAIILASYIPARMILRQEIVDTILGR